MLSAEALAIWKCGVEAVDSKRLVESAVSISSDSLKVCDQQISLESLAHIEIVGGGKAGAGMVAGLLGALRDIPESISVGGWVNVPADCVGDASPVTLHAARPAGVNEPRPEGAEGTKEILRRVSSLTERDLCIVLISGGGSALLPAPAGAISLEDKLAVTRTLASAGATIQELNTVRSRISDIKGGGLLRHCSAGRMVALIISDVVGDPLDKIASGPTVSACCSDEDALNVLAQFDPDRKLPQSVYDHLERPDPRGDEAETTCSNFIVGSNAISLTAAKREAEQRGFAVVDLGSEATGEAADHGRDLLNRLQQIRDSGAGQKVCVLAGGETTVRLAETNDARKGGRNQEVVLAAIADQPTESAWKNIALVSGGTDGEDGPTDAAGAVADESLIRRMIEGGINADDYLRINNSYPFLDQLDGLIRTGPTHTNVMDLAVGLVQS